MKIVCDIAEGMLDELHTCTFPIQEAYRLCEVIENGTPLPKGHGALKDADAIAIQIAMLRDNCNYYGNEYESACFQCYDIAVDEIVDAPTIIEADKEGAEK